MHTEPARAPGRLARASTQLRPSGTLARVRARFLLFGLLTHALLGAVVLLRSTQPLAVRGAAVAALVALGAWWVRGHRRGRFPAAAEPLEALAVVPACVLLTHVSLGGSLVYVALGFRSLYGTARQAVVRAGLYLGVAMVVLASVHLQGGPAASVLLRLPLLVFVLASTFLLGRTLAEQDRALARERVLRDAGIALTTAPSRPAIHRAAVDAALALVADLPGARADLVVGDADGFEIVAAAGEGAERVLGMRVSPAEMSPQIQSALREGAVRYHERLGGDAGPPPNAAALPRGAILLAPLRVHDGTCGALSVMSVVAIPPDVRGALETLAAQIALGLESASLTEELTRQALHDSLTGLANRRLLLGRVQQALSKSGRDHGAVALLLIDLDGFKKVNDTLGHDAGDEVLIAVAAAIGSAIRGGDTLGRLGGDEFAVLLDEVGDAAGARIAADRIVRALSAPIKVRGQEVLAQGSIGIALAGVDVREAADLFANADVAMYRAKRGGGGVAVYEPTMRAGSLERLAMEAALRSALDRRELFLHFQPVVQLDGGAIVGVEALVRWTHKNRPVPPSDFIPVAEECGLIQELGDWVLAEACRVARSWRERVPDGQRFSVSVNVSPRQVRPALLETIGRVLRDSGLPPGSLVLEVTERLLMSDRESAATLRGIKELGVRLAIDDFGTGFSSLGYLKRFEIDVLKIDRSFITHVGTSPRAAALAEAVVRLGRALELDIVAEGIETAEQAAALLAMGCGMGQGYHFCRPLEAAALEQRLFPGARAGAAAGG